MTEQEILPCPNSECAGAARVLGTEEFISGRECEICEVANYVACQACGCRGPQAPCADDARALWNAIPREEPWIEVAKAGLPEPSEQLYDVAGEHDGKSFLTEMVTRADISWELGGSVRVHSDKYGGVSHYRVHRAPKGPR